MPHEKPSSALLRGIPDAGIAPWKLRGFLQRTDKNTSAIKQGVRPAARFFVRARIENDSVRPLRDQLKGIVNAGVNFTNAYGRSGYGNKNAYFVIDPEDVSNAKQKLLDAGLNIMPDESIYGTN